MNQKPDKTNIDHQRGTKSGNEASSPQWELYAGEEPVYRIFVHNLVLPALIGIHPHERDQQQRVRISIELEALDICEQSGDEIDNVLSYEDVVTGVKATLGEGHIGLVETLAERIAALCLSNTYCRKARIRVEKLDVFAEAESVGVEIERRKTSAPDVPPSKVITFGPAPRHS